MKFISITSLALTCLLCIQSLGYAQAILPEEADAQALLLSLKSKSVSGRINEATLKFFSKPYLADPLGEGASGRYDQNPRFRFDGFDCTTFVETMSAIALAENLSEFQTTIDQIRYNNGKVSFQTRNHFTDLEWIPNNIRTGLISDVTRGLFRNQTRVARALIEKNIWYSMLKIDRIVNDKESPQKLIEELHDMSARYLPAEATVEYVGIRALIENPELLDKIPSGAIVNFVRPNWELKKFIGTNMNISHQGFAIRKKNGVLFFRHASSELKLVTEEPIFEYLTRMLAVKSIAGINILVLKTKH